MRSYCLFTSNKVIHEFYFDVPTNLSTLDYTLPYSNGVGSISICTVAFKVKWQECISLLNTSIACLVCLLNRRFTEDSRKKGGKLLPHGIADTL